MNTKETTSTKSILFEQIDALKGIAIFLVVLGHGIIFYPVDLHQNVVCESIFRWLSSVHMPLFFLISGFCFSFKGNYKSFIWKKIKRLLIPHFVFNAIDVVPRALLSSFVNRPRSIGESLQKIVFNGGEYWFLYVLFLIFLFYPLVDKLINNRLYNYLSALGIVFILSLYVSSITIFLLNNVFNYLFYFILGAMIKNQWGTKIFDLKLNKIITFLSICALIAVWMLILRSNGAYSGVCAALIGILTFFLCMQFKLPVSFFKRFGKYSLQLYLFNGYLLVISRTIIVSVLGMTNPFIIIAFNMLIDFFFSYMVIKYICEKIKPVKFLMGMV